VEGPQLESFGQGVIDRTPGVDPLAGTISWYEAACPTVFLRGAAFDKSRCRFTPPKPKVGGMRVAPVILVPVTAPSVVC